MIAEIKRLNPKPGLQFGTVQIQPVLPDVMVRPGARRQLDRRAQQRHAAARARQPQLLHHRQQERALRAGSRLPDRMPAERQLAGQEPRPAGAHHPARGRGDRAPAGRLPDLRHRAPEAAQPEDGGGRHLDARIDRQPRHLQQVHDDPARRVRAQVFLHLGDRLRRTARRRTPRKPCATASAC